MAKRQSYSAFEDNVTDSLLRYKNKNITAEDGCFRGRSNDKVLPDKFAQEFVETPAMLFSGIVDTWKDIQRSAFKYKPHIYAFTHIASSQTACVNLFIPILTSGKANEILKESGIAPKDFDHIDSDSLYKGFQFEFGVGELLEDKSGVVTDSDVAIAYINKNKERCLWLIEHKLTETDFTHCGGYKSKSKVHEENPQYKENCKTCSLEEILSDPKLCYYHAVSNYKYWDIMKGGDKEFFKGEYDEKGCPFRKGMNQLWRNQLLAMALEKQTPNVYKHVCFSVVKHPDNPSLDKTIEDYKKLTNDSPKFSVFTSLDLIRAAEKDPELKEWIAWYKKVYHIVKD